MVINLININFIIRKKIDMFINKKSLLLLFLFLTQIVLFSEIKPEFRLIADFYSAPFFYENTKNMYGLSFNGSIMAGIRINNFTLGAEIFENYYTMASQNNYNFKGAWNIMRWTLDGYHDFLSWFQLKWGIGGAWYRSAFSNMLIGTESQDKGGISFLIETQFIPWKYMDIKGINKLDIFFSKSDAVPYFYYGIRCDFHPYYEWISLYVETGVIPLFYTSQVDSINSSIFVWNIGVSINMTPVRFLKPKKEEKPEIIIEKPKIEENKIVENEKIQENTNIEELKTAKEGDIVTFSNILFYPDKDTIKEQSNSIIDDIAKVLLDRKEIKIELIGYTNDVGNTKLEIELSKKRAEMVKKYLVSKGISADRIITSGFGSKLTKGMTIDEANRKVEIKILK
jgi:outer membrane protein OmpA-like peptidoglycan-associated protein